MVREKEIMHILILFAGNCLMVNLKNVKCLEMILWHFAMRALVNLKHRVLKFLELIHETRIEQTEG
jgi:hypothetical protein